MLRWELLCELLGQAVGALGEYPEGQVLPLLRCARRCWVEVLAGGTELQVGRAGVLVLVGAGPLQPRGGAGVEGRWARRRWVQRCWRGPEGWLWRCGFVAWARYWPCGIRGTEQAWALVHGFTLGVLAQRAFGHRLSLNQLTCACAQSPQEAAARALGVTEGDLPEGAGAGLGGSGGDVWLVAVCWAVVRALWNALCAMERRPGPVCAAFVNTALLPALYLEKVGVGVPLKGQVQGVKKPGSHT